MTTNNNSQSITQTSAAICAIQKQGLRYVDEWVDHHIGIGFTTIYIYDNSEDFEIKEWHSKRFLQQSTTGSNSYRAEPPVQIIHWPGTHAGGQQLPAYSNCTNWLPQQGRSLFATNWGEQEDYTDQLFELYARLSYTQRISDICEEEGEAVLPLAQSVHLTSLESR